MMKIYPSLLAADVLRLAEAIKRLEPYCDGFHLDVMDGHFVKNISGGVDLINAVQQVTKKPITVHLMVEKPETWLDRLSLRSFDCVIFHWEAAAGELAKEIIDKATANHWCVGIALRPQTPIAELGALLPLLRLVLVMSVEPGFSGQLFNEHAISKVQELVDLRVATKGTFELMVDGGVDKHRVAQLANLGVDMVAVGAAIFESKNPIEALKELKKAS